MHLRDSAFMGSVENLILGQIRYLSKQGYTFAIGSFSYPHLQNPLLEKARQLHCHTFLMNRYPTAPLKLIKELNAHKPHLLVCHDYKSNLVALPTAKLLRVPIITVFHGRTSHNRKILFYESLDDLAIPHFDLLHHLAPGPSLRKELGLPDNARLVVTIGRVSPEKGQQLFVDAAFRLLATLPGTYFLVVGDGPDLENLKSRVAAARQAQRIHFLGYRDDVPRILAQSDLLVNPSLREGMPIIILEAFALRVPVLCTPVGGVPELVRDGITGYIFPAGNAQILSQRIAEVLNRRDNSTIVDNAYRLLTTTHTIERQSSDIARLYADLLHATPNDYL